MPDKVPSAGEMATIIYRSARREVLAAEGISSIAAAIKADRERIRADEREAAAERVERGVDSGSEITGSMSISKAVSLILCGNDPKEAPDA